MNHLKVKEILDYISADIVEVVEIKHYAGTKPSEKIVLYKYEFDEDLDANEIINDKNYENRIVECVLALNKARIQVRVFPKEL